MATEEARKKVMEEKVKKMGLLSENLVKESVGNVDSSVETASNSNWTRRQELAAVLKKTNQAGIGPAVIFLR